MWIVWEFLVVLLYIFYLGFVFIGFGLLFLIISTYYIISLEVKIFYLLNIIATIIPITFIIMLSFGGSKEVLL